MGIGDRGLGLIPNPNIINIKFETKINRKIKSLIFKNKILKLIKYPQKRCKNLHLKKANIAKKDVKIYISKKQKSQKRCKNLHLKKQKSQKICIYISNKQILQKRCKNLHLK